MALSLTKRQLLETILAQQNQLLTLQQQLIRTSSEQHAELVTLLTGLTQGQESTMQGFEQELADLTAEVHRSTDVQSGAVALIQTLADKIAAAADDPAQVRALADELRVQNDALAAALVANTPSAPDAGATTSATTADAGEGGDTGAAGAGTTTSAGDPNA